MLTYAAVIALKVSYAPQEVRPLEVMNVQQASISELTLQDAWRAEFSRHSKGLLMKVWQSHLAAPDMPDPVPSLHTALEC